jgi:hypothetical protein
VLQRLQAVRKTGQTMAQRDTADPTGRDETPPFFRNSLLVRVWPWAA